MVRPELYMALIAVLVVLALYVYSTSRNDTEIADVVSQMSADDVDAAAGGPEDVVLPRSEEVALKANAMPDTAHSAAVANGDMPKQKLVQAALESGMYDEVERGGEGGFDAYAEAVGNEVVAEGGEAVAVKVSGDTEDNKDEDYVEKVVEFVDIKPRKFDVGSWDGNSFDRHARASSFDVGRSTVDGERIVTSFVPARRQTGAVALLSHTPSSGLKDAMAASTHGRRESYTPLGMKKRLRFRSHNRGSLSFSEIPRE
jgi:hypothetical protein